MSVQNHHWIGTPSDSLASATPRHCSAAVATTEEDTLADPWHSVDEPAADRYAGLVDDRVAVEVEMVVEIGQKNAGGSFDVVLSRNETRWWDNDPQPDYVETILCETTFTVALPTVFAAVDYWLAAMHRLKVLPHTWQACEAGDSTGVVLLLEGRAVPARQAAHMPAA